ncbi:unnamed protein product [Rotaria magnacalcarata]|uniref:Uncharacterized protein n=1 Tax=Rotaria magnacalcarata TaxID=392030 RepID=A0A819E370_9BILA|nr:unnamed protein product [Rotaria magnacalcarata]CAF3896366.1 unnamed protein product [Rotaria magnacalcarata]
MQIATINYPPNPKENFQSDPRSAFHDRQVLTIVTNAEKKQKQRRSFLSDLTANSNKRLPPMKKNSNRPSSMRIKGNGFTASKLHDKSMTSCNQPRRTQSRLSEKNDAIGTRSRSVTPTGAMRSPSKLLSLKFGYPVKLRSSDFYAPSLTESELRLREVSFVSDSIRSANHGCHSTVIPQYEPLQDPNLKDFFQSSLVLDVVRKTLNMDLSERTSENDRDDDYRRIVAKHSSGYGKLNGYDCIPRNAPPRHYRSMTHAKFRSPSNSSFTSFPTYSSIHFQPKKNSRQSYKAKHLAPLAALSSLSNPTETTSDTAPVSNVSQE